MLAFKVSDELEHAYTHAHTVTVDLLCTIAIESTSSCKEMRGYLELPVRGGQENNSLPAAPPKKLLSIARLLY